MLFTEYIAVRLAIALGIGLLIGLERERSKGKGPTRGAAGIRTFALTSLAGALGYWAGGEMILAVLGLAVGLLAVASYVRGPKGDPGFTTEMALLTTFLLGAAAIRDPALAAGLAVMVAMLLAARTRLHRFVQRVLTEQEIHDALILLASVAVILPLAPDRAVDPWGALNPRKIWELAVLVMALSSAGHLALRTLGTRYGLPLSGLASGFVSALATHAAMGARALKKPAFLKAAVSGAALSNVATVVQMTLVLGATSRSALMAMSAPLAAMGAVALASGLYFAWHVVRKTEPDAAFAGGRVFDPRTAVLFAGTVSVVMLVSVILNKFFGAAGLLAGSALAGLADAHSVGISCASLVAAGKLSPQEAVWPIMAGITTNTLAKLFVCVTSGGKAFALRLAPALGLLIAAGWAGALVTGLQ